MRINVIASVFVCCCLSVITNSSSAKTDLLIKQKILTHINSPTLSLGDGYISYNRLSVLESGLKLDKTNTKYSSIQSTIFLTQAIDHYDLAKTLNVDLTANGGWGLFSASASASYLHHTEDTQFSENFTFMERYYVKASLDISNLPANISAFTDNASELYQKKDIKTFTNRYGDTFISELPIGAVLVTNVQLNFVTALDKQKFDATIAGKISSIFNATLRIEDAITKSKVKGFMEISAYQMGGNPEELPKIFTKKKDEDYYFTTCSLDNLKDCRQVLNGIINYAQVDFKQQIHPNGVGEKPNGNLVVVGEPMLTTYASKFNLMPAPRLEMSILKNRLELGTLYKNVKNTKTFFDHYITSPVATYFSADAFNIIKNIQESLNWNLNLIRDYAPMCYISGDEMRCPEILKSIIDNSKTLDQSAIDYYINTGFNQISSDCNYIPVGTPDGKNPIFVNYCYGHWIKGLFIFKFNADKSILEVNGDYISLNGNHYQSTATLKPFNNNTLYNGTIYFRPVGFGFRFKENVSIRLTRNNV